MEDVQQYSYQYNKKVVVFSQAKESESSEDRAKLCLQLFSCLGVDGITLTSAIAFREERVLLVTNLNLSFASSLVYQFDFKGLPFDCYIYGFIVSTKLCCY